MSQNINTVDISNDANLEDYVLVSVNGSLRRVKVANLKELVDSTEDVVVVDTELSTTSVNPVQNKVITTELNKKANSSDMSTYQTKIDNALTTTSKEVVGAINENTTSINQLSGGKADKSEVSELKEDIVVLEDLVGGKRTGQYTENMFEACYAINSNNGVREYNKWSTSVATNDAFFNNSSEMYLYSDFADGYEFELFLYNADGSYIKAYSYDDNENGRVVEPNSYFRLQIRKRGVSVIDVSECVNHIYYDYTKEGIYTEVQVLKQESLKNNAYYDEFVLGNINISASGWVYDKNSRTRVSTKENFSIHLMKGNVIGLKDYSDARYYVGWKRNDGTYGYKGWLKEDYVIAENGDYVILICNNVDRQQTSKEALCDLLFIAQNPSIKTVIDYADKLNLDALDTIKKSKYFVKGINHRGYNIIAPENTLSAFKLSKIMGFDYVETDVSFTSDGVAVCLHDDTVDRTSNGTGNINDLTFEYVRSLDFGSWKSTAYNGEKIPTLEEFLVLCRNIGLEAYIELKNSATYSEEQIQNIVNTVRKCGMSKYVTYISFSSQYLTYVKDYDGKARLGFVSNSGTTSQNELNIALGLKTEYNEVFVDASTADSSMIGDYASGDVGIEVWTYNTEQSIISLNPYVTGVTSDSLNASEVLYENSIN